MADVAFVLTKSFSLKIADLLPDSGAESRLKQELLNYHRDPSPANQATASTTINALSQSRQFELKRLLGGRSDGAKSPDIVDNS